MVGLQRFGAVDIGSNSIRMQAAEVVPGESPRPLVEDRAVARLGASVFQQGVVSTEAMDHAGRVLRRMAATLREHEIVAFRAVATSAIRDARNQDEFLMRAQLALGGVRPEIISGGEEARLIHLGVQSRWPQGRENIVIIDIGGGSAEVIESRCGKVVTALSKPLGAVRLSQMFFAHDPPSARELRQFTDYVREKIVPITDQIKGGSFDQVVATAATAAAVVRAIHGVAASEANEIDRLSVSSSDVLELYEKLAHQRLRERQLINGIGTRRAEIVIAGAGVLALVLEAIGADACSYSAAGVRDGVMADLAARYSELSRARLDEDQRRSVLSLADRCGVERKHAERVAEISGQLFEALGTVHGLGPRYGGLLEAAAHLHDAGHFVSSTRHHRHSFYLVVNSDLPGLDASDRLFIGNLCRYHRKNMPKPSHENLRGLDDEQQEALLKIIPLLRIADSLDRSHRQVVDAVEVTVGPEEVVLDLSSSGEAALEQWAAAQQSEVFLQVYGRRLVVNDRIK
jgi:exopolyphosphatase/guanosine-5'-triphosphate,3'-diphosphate pyrophosphatase